ncbi:vesicle transport protein GOT1 isoform X2 [Ziziphus jujuba]|uniref:Vesicle transport protein GOT1 isoform X2 n=1 Tax=Ziziphus jujuba TaxID=326968 RepID=A0A6P6FPQ5_ZIZJJ|nr:vesicle transport protein GOT1 isoform X2 [Ziziphus jujuba]
MVSFELNDQKKIGAGLTTFGIIFSFLGLIFLFDKKLLAVGNILFLSGLFLLIGLKSTMQFLVKPQNIKGTISFGAGFLFVVIGWPISGMILEGSGFFMLFSCFWPTMAIFLQKIPILGWFLKQSYVRSLKQLDYEDIE